MSQENVEVAKTFLAAFAERDFEAGARFLIPRWKFVQRLSEGLRAPSIVARPA